MSQLIQLRGRNALSTFRQEKLQQVLAQVAPAIEAVHAEFWHFVALHRPLSSDERATLERLLTYGAQTKAGDTRGHLLLVTPRAGTISPWSSKATNIALQCGLDAVQRIERGVAWYLRRAGCSRFFLSLEDDLMRIFGSDRMGGMLQKLGLKEGEAIVHSWINKALERAQKKVEARNFDTRKNVLKYDDVMNDQRKEVYAQRRAFMLAEDVSETVAEMRRETIDTMVSKAIPENAYPEQWNLAGLQERVTAILNLDLPVADWAREEGIDDEAVRERLHDAAERAFAARAANIGPDLMRMVEKSLLLQVFDQAWKDHLLSLDHLRQGIGLRAYGQRDPLNEYKSEAFLLFNTMLDELRERVTGLLMRVELRPEEPFPMPEPVRITDMRHPDPAMAGGGLEAFGAQGYDPVPMAAALPRPVTAAVDATDPSTWGNTPRNAPCPCGSGKKFKHCHGR